VAILEVQDLSIKFKMPDGIVEAVNKVSFSVNHGEIVGIVGESGSGKSQTILAILGLLAKNALVTGSVRFCEQELLGLNEKKLNNVRGDKIAMIFQDPMTSLNPYLTIKSQMLEVLVEHRGMTKSGALHESIRMLDFVKIREAKNTIKHYPHQLSGGMRQRVMIAMALLCKPELILADEPTTALDVTVQAQILQILRELKEEFGTSIIMITHDMGVVANICDIVHVMYQGKIVESGAVDDIFYQPQNEYTKALLNSIL
jgi:oligopeptide transport system ATP-binding protein